MWTGKTHLAAGLLALALLFGGPAAAITYAAPPDQVARQATVGNLIAALNNINVQIQRLRVLNNLTLTDVQVVNVEDVLNDNNTRAFNNALNRNEVNVGILQDFLNDNTILNGNVVTVRNVLNDLNIDFDDVVAINVLSDGKVIVFYQD